MGESAPVLSTRLSPIKLLRDIVLHPAQTFTQLKDAEKRTCWIAAVVIVVLCTLPLIAQQITGAGSQAALSGAPDKFGAVTASPDAMMMESEAMASTTPTGPGIFGIVGSIFGTALTWLIWAGGLHLASVFLGRSNSFKQMLKLPVWAWIPYAFRGILQTGYILLAHTPIVNAGLSGFVIDKGVEQIIPPGPGSLALASVLGHIDIFQLWTLLLISVGLTAFTEIPRKKSLIATLIIWALLLLISAIAAIVGGMFSGRTRLGDVVLHLYGMPGQSRFEFMWDILMREMDGFILMVDSEDRASLMEVKQLLRLYRRGGRVPFVIAANKQDGSAPLPPAEIGRLLNLPEAVPVVACVALDPARARPVLETMAQLLTRAKAAA